MRLFISLFGLFAVMASALAQDGAEVKPNEVLPESTAPRHVRVLWMEEPTTKAVVSWSTTLPGNRSRLHYDTESRGGTAGDYQQRSIEVHQGEYTRSKADLDYGQPPLYYHHVLLENLEPATTYYFIVATDGDTSKEFHFVTAPADGRPVKVLFGGDSRIGGSEPYLHEDRRAINLRMKALTEEHPEIIAFTHGGDFYQTAELRYTSPWLTDHELCVTDAGRIIPIVPVRGNHDRAIGFEEMFHWPGREHEYYYVTQLSGEVAILTLNTEIPLGGTQQRVADRELRKLRPENRWLVVQYHKPAYPSVRGWTDGEDRRYFFVPLFERNNVDLVCESHDHALKRTLPIRDGGPHKHGITYIGDGGAGVPQRNPDPSRWYLQEPGMTKSVHHIHLLEFDADKLRGRAFGIDGEVHDDFTLLPGQSAPPEEE
jgi:hypothetical protein